MTNQEHLTRMRAELLKQETFLRIETAWTYERIEKSLSLVDGQPTYTIDLKDQDNFRVNLFVHSWSTPIENVSFADIKWRRLYELCANVIIKDGDTLRYLKRRDPPMGEVIDDLINSLSYRTPLPVIRIDYEAS